MVPVDLGASSTRVHSPPWLKCPVSRVLTPGSCQTHCPMLLPSYLASGWQRVLQLPISQAAQQMERFSLQVAQWCEPLSGSLAALRESLDFLFAYVSWVGKDPLNSLSFRNFLILLICFLTEIKKER